MGGMMETYLQAHGLGVFELSFIEKKRDIYDDAAMGIILLRTPSMHETRKINHNVS
jgi:hypothetical protein